MHRRAFAISPIPIVLLLLLLGMVAWKYSFQRGLIPAAHPRAESAKSKVLRNNASTFLVSSFLSCAVGAGAYFAFRRSDKAANAAASICLAIPVTLLTIQAAKTATASPPSAPATARSNNTDPTTAGLQRIAGALENQSKPIQQPPAVTPRPLAPAPDSSSPPAQTPAPLPASNPPSPAPSSTQPTPTPSRNPRPAQPSVSPSPDVTRALEKLESELNAQIESVLASADPVLAHIAKPPRADRADLKKRGDSISPVKASLETLSKRLRDVITEARDLIQPLDPDRAHGHAIRFSNTFNANQRAFACDSLGRTLEQAKEEADFLLESYTKWKVGRDGKIESKDFKIQSHANSARFHIDARLDRKPTEIARIRGQ